MPRAFVAVGSNVDPAPNVLRAVRRLADRTRIVGISTVYRTAALGRPEQADYYNCVVGVDTALRPLEFKRLLNDIEDELGRRRTSDKYAARCIDLDLISYGELVINTPELTIPDPDILKRAFLAAGLGELAPSMVLAGYGRSVAAVAAELAADTLTALHSYTQQLRAAVQH